MTEKPRFHINMTFCETTVHVVDTTGAVSAMVINVGKIIRKRNCAAIFADVVAVLKDAGDIGRDDTAACITHPAVAQGKKKAEK